MRQRLDFAWFAACGKLLEPFRPEDNGAALNRLSSWTMNATELKKYSSIIRRGSISSKTIKNKAADGRHGGSRFASWI
jgi:hypothetical protein